MKNIIIPMLCALCAAAANGADPTMTPKDGYPAFALGADVSWTPYIEANHLHTYYSGNVVAADQVTDIPSMVTDHGIDAVRLRVWVNPRNDKAMAGFSFKVDGATYSEMSTFGTCSPEEMASLARRFAMQGQRVMVTFQLSDTWADPARQFIPADWSGCTTVDDLSAKACEHVSNVLSLLHDANVNVAWVQVGNETNTGMLKWNLPASITGTPTVTSASYGCEISQKSNGDPSETTKNFVKVFNDVAAAAKTIYPDVKIVLHLAESTKWSHVNWTMGLLKRAGFLSGLCDYVGLSLYPGLDDGQDNYTAKWRTYADLAISTVGKLYSEYGYRSIICEMGMNNEYSLSANMSGVGKGDEQRVYIEQCNHDVRDLTQYLIDNLDTADGTCDGLFYWEPETDYMKEYTKGACVSITPGASWPRDKVTANDWWRVVKEHSTFPAGGLVEYRVNDNTEPDFRPDPSLALSLYYYADADQFVPLCTTDGLLYTLTDFAAPQWFNFKVVTDDWSIALGNTEIGLNQVGYLNANNDWFAWTSTLTEPSYYWWYRHDNHAMTITANDVCPWPDIASAASIASDAPEAEYYTLQGIKVSNPSRGIYIMRQGSKVCTLYLR